MSTPIRIFGRTDFSCPLGWTVERAERRIRLVHSRAEGCIFKNGTATDSSDMIQNDGNYEFVDFLIPQSSKSDVVV